MKVGEYYLGDCVLNVAKLRVFGLKFDHLEKAHIILIKH